jgi:hypothetical protein
MRGFSLPEAHQQLMSGAIIHQRQPQWLVVYGTAIDKRRRNAGCNLVGVLHDNLVV